MRDVVLPSWRQTKARERIGLAGSRLARLLRSAGPEAPAAFYLAHGDPGIDAMMESVGAQAGGVRRLELAALAFTDFPDAAAVADRAIETAKKPSARKALSRLKRELYRAQYNWARGHFARHPGAIAITWNGLTSTRYAFMEAARREGAPRLFLERAPLPGRVTVDPAGVNALNSVPRRREAFEAWAGDDAVLRGDGWRRLAADLSARASTRADVMQGAGEGLDGEDFLFCPLQVPNDTQIRQFGGWVGSVEGQIHAMARAADLLPAGWHLRIKEHPSSRIAFTDLLGDLAAASDGRIVIDNATDTFAQVAASRGVITINSSVGLQAFFFDRPVMVLGAAFYAQDGLVTSVESEEAMRRLFAEPAAMTFDPAFRDLFMNYLDREYYPVVRTIDGRIEVDPENAARKIAAARAEAAEAGA